MSNHLDFMHEAVKRALEGCSTNEGGPFGCLVVKNGEIIGSGCNTVTSGKDPTAHAEINAIREACKHLSSFQLEGCVIYSSCEPCPMCLGAIYWARPDKVYYGCSNNDASKVGFDNDFIYKEIEVPYGKRKVTFERLDAEIAAMPFTEWVHKLDKKMY